MTLARNENLNMRGSNENSDMGCGVSRGMLSGLFGMAGLLCAACSL